MREIRLSGSEGGETDNPSSLPLSRVERRADYPLPYGRGSWVALPQEDARRGRGSYIDRWIFAGG